MLKKIISSGQAGIEKAALDTAMQLGISHGGWMPKDRGRATTYLDQYNLQETKTGDLNYAEKNVVDADGTLFFSLGKMEEGTTIWSKILSKRHNRPFLHINLDKTSKFSAALQICNWIFKKNIELLNVSGSVTQNNSVVDSDVNDILASVYHLSLVRSGPEMHIPDRSGRLKPPATVNEAIQRLMAGMPLKDKVALAHMTLDELTALNVLLGQYIRKNFGLWTGNRELMESCCAVAEKDYLDEDQASATIIKELWKKLKKTYRLRLVK
jgi:hypothetical protein